MATSAEQINQLIGGYTDLKAYFEGERARIEAARSSALEDVSDAIKAEMYFDALLDPALVTNVNNREFKSLDDLLKAAPAGSLINARCAAGKTIPMNSSAIVSRSAVFFSKEGNGANPVIAPGVQEYEGTNRLHIISALGDSHFYFQNVNITLPAKINPGLEWRGDHAGMIRGLHGGSGLGVGFRECVISGADAGTSLVNPMLGGIVTVGLYQTTIDKVTAIGAAGSGSAVVAKFAVTLVNDGSIYATGTPAGGNILEN